MEYFKLNITDLTPSASQNLSDGHLSVGTEGGNNAMTGGFFWSSKGKCSENNEKAVIAAAQGKYDVVEFMINNDMIDDFSHTDKNGNTILHYLLQDVADKYENCLCKIFKCSKIGDVLCIQNDEGDTPLHICVKTGNMLMAERLIELGADKSVRNKKGLYVETDTGNVDDDENCECNNVSEETPSTEAFLNELFKRKSQEQQCLEPQLQRGIKIERLLGGLGTETEDIIKEAQQHTNKKEKKEKMDKMDKATTGGSVNQNTEEQFDNAIGRIDNILGSLGRSNHQNQFKKTTRTTGMMGGSLIGKTGGKRKNNADSGRRNANELSQLIKNQSKEIHRRVTQNIGEILHVGGDEAKLYKNALYNKVVMENKGMKSELDRSVEMEKTLSKKTLKNLDIEGFIKRRNKGKNKMVDTISATSTISFGGKVSKFSETSMSDDDDNPTKDKNEDENEDEDEEDSKEEVPESSQQIFNRFEEDSHVGHHANTISATSSAIINTNRKFSDTSFSQTEAQSEQKKDKFNGFTNSLDSLSSSDDF